jgi:hypothetical protein
MPVLLFIMPATPIVPLFIGSPNVVSGHKRISSRIKYFIARALSMVQIRCKALNQAAPEISQTPVLILLSFFGNLSLFNFVLFCHYVTESFKQDHLAFTSS